MPFRKALWKIFGILFLLPVTACPQSGPKAERPGPTPQSMAEADHVQSILNCMHDFEMSSKDRPEIVALINGQHFAVFNWKDHSPPRLTSGLQCSFAAVTDTSNGHMMAVPVCKFGGSWHAFGSGYGPVVWAKPFLACQGVRASRPEA